jgi:ferredoxin--NADP+ reductase
MVIGNRYRLAPFISMLQDFETWSKYEKSIWCIAFELNLNWLMSIGSRDCPAFGEGHTGFKFIPIVTRDPNAALHDRLPILIENGELEKAADLKFNADTTHVMLCGIHKW